MTFFTDDRLRQAAQEAGAILDGSLPAPEDCPHTFSLPFQAKMAKLLRRHKRAPARRAMRRVACLALVCLLGSGVFLTTNAQAREAFFGWIREQVEGAQRYFHTGKATLPEEIVHYQITVPEEYTLVSGLTSDTFVNQGYESPSGGYISFSYQYETVPEICTSWTRRHSEPRWRSTVLPQTCISPMIQSPPTPSSGWTRKQAL